MTSVPPGWHTVTPRIVVKDAPGLVAFIKKVFGANGDFNAAAPSLVWIGDSLLMVSDPWGNVWQIAAYRVS